jgi:hypothetical protein
MYVNRASGVRKTPHACTPACAGTSPSVAPAALFLRDAARRVQTNPGAAGMVSIPDAAPPISGTMLRDVVVSCCALCESAVRPQPVSWKIAAQSLHLLASIGPGCLKTNRHSRTETGCTPRSLTHRKP